MRTFEIFAEGIPAPQGSKKYVGHRGGKAVLVEMSKKVKPWREAVRSQSLVLLQRYEEQGEPWEMLDGPLILEVVFYLPRPASKPKTRRVEPIGPPDLSKLIRSTEDALTDAGVWRDDARVVRVVADKLYAVTPDLARIYDPMRSIPKTGAMITAYPALPR